MTLQNLLSGGIYKYVDTLNLNVMSVKTPNNWRQVAANKWRRETDYGVETVELSQNGSEYSVYIVEGGSTVDKSDFASEAEAEAHVEDYLADHSA